MSTAFIQSNKIFMPGVASVRVRNKKNKLDVIEKDKNHFSATFEIEDIGFQLEIKNGTHKGLYFEIRTFGKDEKIFIEPCGVLLLEKFESNKGKFHFISRKSDQGSQFVYC